MIHTNMPRNVTVFLIRRELARSALSWSKNCDSVKWPTVLLVHDVKGKPCNFE